MFNRFFDSVLLVAAAGLMALPAMAAEQQQDVEVQMEQRVPAGKQPAVLLIVNKTVAKVTLRLRSKDGEFVKKHGAAAKGRKIRFVLPHKKPGNRNWRGAIDVTFSDGSTGRLPVTFTTQVVGQFNFVPLHTLLDIKERNLIKIKSDRAVSAIDVEVHGIEGDLLANVSKEFHGAKPNEVLEVSWVPAKDQAPYRVRIVVHDVNGFFRSMESYVFEYDVPHQDVVFATGKATITPAEEKKLLNSLDELRKVVARAAKAAKVTGTKQNLARLFIVGHTDTVGSKEHNKKLSNQRAIAIANWFAKKGVKVPIYAVGVGEKYLKVATPDETAEEINRGITYTLSNNFPYGLPKAAFKRVR
ncbi:MAG: OmpA family protein [Deltaproteobacteria bacterium]|nr:OmpA family protein [Deltaproteobacteria bacterium]